MKRLGLWAAAFLAVSCVSQPASPPAGDSPAEAATVKAPVRKERIEEYKVPVVVKETVLFADGMVDRIISYSYSDDYTTLLSSTSRKTPAGDPVERVVFEYAGGRLAARSTFGPDNALSAKSIYQYGAGGELVRETIADGKGVVQSLSEWTWDKNHKASWRVLSAAGVVMARTDYSYDGDRLVSSRLMDGSGNDKGRIDYSYDGGDKPVRVQYFNAAGSPDGSIDYAFKAGLVVTESVRRADGRLERRLAYEYSPDGALVKKTLSDSSGKEREVYVYENAYRTETRTLVYYE